MAAEKLAADSVTLASAASPPQLFTCLQRGLGCVSISVLVPQTRALGTAGTPHFSGSGRVIPQTRKDRKLRQPGAARGRPTSGPSRSVPVLYRGNMTVRTPLPGCREGKGVLWGRGGSRGEPQGCRASARATGVVHLHLLPALAHQAAVTRAGGMAAPLWGEGNLGQRL